MNDAQLIKDIYSGNLTWVSDIKVALHGLELRLNSVEIAQARALDTAKSANDAALLAIRIAKESAVSAIDVAKETVDKTQVQNSTRLELLEKKVFRDSSFSFSGIMEFITAAPLIIHALWVIPATVGVIIGVIEHYKP